MYRKSFGVCISLLVAVVVAAAAVDVPSQVRLSATQIADKNVEWDTDLLFKKPWTLSEKVEFMAGVGPEWVHTRQNGTVANSVAGEVVLDFMFWPSAQHRFGWFLEPGYEYNFGRGHERSIVISGGLLIAIPRLRKSSRPHFTKDRV